jgi:hypothetical protein
VEIPTTTTTKRPRPGIIYHNNKRKVEPSRRLRLCNVEWVKKGKLLYFYFTLPEFTYTHITFTGCQYLVLLSQIYSLYRLIRFSPYPYRTRISSSPCNVTIHDRPCFPFPFLSFAFVCTYWTVPYAYVLYSDALLGRYSSISASNEDACMQRPPGSTFHVPVFQFSPSHGSTTWKLGTECYMAGCWFVRWIPSTSGSLAVAVGIRKVKGKGFVAMYEPWYGQSLFAEVLQRGSQTIRCCW